MAEKKQTPKKPWVPEGGAPQMRPQRDAAAALKKLVIDRADEIFDRYVEGESFLQISRSLPFKIPHWKMRTILMESEETRDLYANAAINRAHSLVESAIDYGRDAAAIGDAAGYRAAIDVNLKVAAKMAPREYGDTKKVELTGKDGNPLQIQADLSLTAEQAYERLIKGD